jgi:periplasmic protein TonB
VKLPFSYKKNIFNSVLLLSFAGHIAFLGFGNSLVASPEFAVEKAPSSVELVLIEKQKPIVERFVSDQQVIAVEQELVQAQVKKREKRLELEPIKVPLQSFIEQGALAEQKPVYLENPAPVYPVLARKNGWEGVVVLRVLVEKNGNAGRVEIKQSSGRDVLDQAAARTVRGWKFAPARLGKVLFSSWVEIPIQFKLKDK